MQFVVDDRSYKQDPAKNRARFNKWKALHREQLNEYKKKKQRQYRTRGTDNWLNRQKIRWATNLAMKKARNMGFMSYWP